MLHEDQVEDDLSMGYHLLIPPKFLIPDHQKQFGCEWPPTPLYGIWQLVPKVPIPCDPEAMPICRDWTSDVPMGSRELIREYPVWANNLCPV